MKYRHLILRNLFRKKIRTTLTLGSFAVALFLFGLLAVVRGAFQQGVDVAAADRLTVINKVSIIQPIPLSYEDRIRQIRGVSLVTHQNWFGGVYQDPKNFFAQMAIEDDSFFQVYPEFIVPPDQMKSYLADQEGVIVGQKIAKRFGWKIGDRIPIKGTIFPGEWDFNIRGIYHGKRRQDDETQLWFHYKNLDQWVQTKAPTGYWKGMIGWYVVKIQNPDDAPRIAKEIDTMFSNSPWETKTEVEKAFANNFAKQAGNIGFLVTAIGTVVFFTLLLVTGNTMATAVRERTRELAVLKAVGFSDNFVLFLVFAESLVLAIIGGGLGLLLAKFMTLGGDPTGGMLGAFYLPTASLVFGIGLALLVGIASGFFPALSAMRLRVVDALRRV